jgi:hypothetical protein
VQCSTKVQSIVAGGFKPSFDLTKRRGIATQFASCLLPGYQKTEGRRPGVDVMLIQGPYMSMVYLAALAGVFVLILAVVASAVGEVHRRPNWLTATEHSPLELAETARLQKIAAAREVVVQPVAEEKSASVVPALPVVAKAKQSADSPELQAEPA